MLDRSLVWTGDLNNAAGVPPLRNVGLYDTTLRDGEQTVGVVLGPDDKLAIATALDRLGIQRIEAGFPRVSDADVRAFELIMAADLQAEVWGFSRALARDVEQLISLGIRGAVVEAPLSDAKVRAYGLDREEVLKRIKDAVAEAVAGGITVCFFGVDGTRADLDFLRLAYSTAVEAGATEIALVDTIGIATPEAVEFLVGEARRWVGDDVAIHWHGHDDFGLATSCSLAAVRSGAEWVHGTINGMGERAGNTDLGEFALALEALYGVDTGLRLELISEVAELVQQRSGYNLAPWKPVTGRNLFVRESGAVAAQFHDPPAIEPYSSSLVGATRGLVLGKKSGLSSIKIKLAELGIDIGVERHDELLSQVKQLAVERRSLVTDEQFGELAAAMATNASGARG